MEQIAFPVGYGVEAAHLIDLYATNGLAAFAQTNLSQRCHRSRTNQELGRMSFAILQVLNRRLQQRGVLPDVPLCTEGLRQFHLQGRYHRQEVHRMMEHERPPMREVAAYRQKRGWMLRDENHSVGDSTENSGCMAAVRGM